MLNVFKRDLMELEKNFRSNNLNGMEYSYE